jgi:DNA-directed RNA polymerase beta' subunit
MSSKRKLDTIEIEDILQVIKPTRGIPKATADSIVKINQQKLRAQLIHIEIYPELISQLKKDIEKDYLNTIVQPGESVGVTTAQSIGERQTQTTLNTFHSCGQAIKTVVTGVPRFSELLNATREPKAVNCNIYFKKMADSIDTLRQIISYDFAYNNLGSLMKSRKFFTNKKREPWYGVWTSLHGNEFEKYNHGISFQLDLTKLYEFSIPLALVAEKITENFGDAICVRSPDSLGIIDVWVDVSEVTNDEGIFDTIEEARVTYLEEVVQPALKDLHICGIPGVRNIFYEKKNGEWMIETDGSNLRQIFAHPDVDMTRSMCNNVWEIYETLGIEAARNFLVEEFGAVISADGTFVNESHALLLVDLMTYGGSIVSVSRYGLKKESCGPMAKASFEESLDNFLKAGQYAEKETTNGVSASIMLGKMARFGTGVCDVIMDIKQLANAIPIITPKVRENS